MERLAPPPATASHPALGGGPWDATAEEGRSCKPEITRTVQCRQKQDVKAFHSQSPRLPEFFELAEGKQA